MTAIRPRLPEGLYPHDRLCGQAGTAPINIRIRITNRMVPMASSLSQLEVASADPR